MKSNQTGHKSVGFVNKTGIGLPKLAGIQLLKDSVVALVGHSLT